MTVRHQEVEILVEDLSTLQKVRRQPPDAMQMVRDLQARMEVQKEVMGRKRTSTRGAMRSSSLWWKRKRRRLQSCGGI